MKINLYFDKYLLKVNLIFVTLLVTFGIFLVSSATAVESQRIYNDSFYMIKNHLLALMIGIFAAFLITKIDYKNFTNLSNYLIIFITLILFFLLTYGENVFGSTRWLDLGFVRLQPSEIAKPIIIIWVADQLSKVELDVNNIQSIWRASFMPGIAIILIFLQPDFGTAATLAFIVFVQLLFSRVKFIYPALLSVVAWFAGKFFLSSEIYRAERLRVWSEGICDQGLELLGSCFQVHQSRIAISSGGMFGLGPGTSRARWGSLPSAYSDFISAIIGEEYGFVGYIVFIFILSISIISFFLIALRQKNEFKRIFTVGLGAWILFQSVLNLGASVYLLPITGIVLPFVSYGGSAMVSIFIALGIMHSRDYE
jgi:cell division protein FtsW